MYRTKYLLYQVLDPRCFSNRSSFDDADLSPIRWERGFHIHVAVKFKYLGSRLCITCIDTLDVSSRIESATKAFGALKKCVFSSNNISSTIAKRIVYGAVILSVLLYGCECLSLTENTLFRLRVFHNQCIRTMCRVTRNHNWEHGISNEPLR